jgi:pimeloyl-ACP methyl ester carboxylesterase
LPINTVRFLAYRSPSSSRKPEPGIRIAHLTSSRSRQKPRLRTCLAAFDVLVPPNPAYRDVVGAIDVPTLLVIGDSPVVTLEMAAELRSLNTRLQVEQIPNAGHGVPFEQPGRLSEVVLSFLREILGGCAPATWN